MASREELILEAEKRGLLTSRQQELLAEARNRGMTPTPPPTSRPTLQERAREVLPYEDLAARGTLLPIGRTQEGKVVPAVPQIIKDVTESALLPGHVAGHLVPGSSMQGTPPGSFTPEDVARFTLDIAAPMTAGRGVGAARSALPNKRRFVKEAPNEQALRKMAKDELGRAKATGVVADPDSYLDLLASMEETTNIEKMHPTLHPRSTAAFDVLTRDLSKPKDVEDLMVARRILGVAQRGVDPEGADDRRIAGMLEDMLDDYVDNLSAKDVVAGSPEGLGENLKRFRGLWQRMRKAEIIENIGANAENYLSGFESGVRNQLKSLLRDKRRLRGFTEGEKRLMQRTLEGGSVQKLMRLLGKMSFGTRGGSNWLGGTAGGTLGGTVGFAAGGPTGAILGAAIPPTVGYVGQKAADANTRAALDLSRALAATGGGIPLSRTVDNMMRGLMELGGPTLAAHPPEERRPLTARQLRDMF